MATYLKGLDTLRAIAALTVVWGHVELIKKNNGIGSLLNESHFNVPSGHLAVVLFFVISGFLITFLLVKEQEKEGSISLRKFYMRRILRIWPLYYFILIVSFLLFRVDYPVRSVLLCFSIFPNVAHALGDGWPSSPQLWSIGVEEQFYLFWPLCLIIIPAKRMPLALVMFFIGYSLLPFFIGFINNRTIMNSELMEFVSKLFYGTKFNCMSAGALLGFLYAQKSVWLKYIHSNFLALTSVVLSALLWIFGFEWELLNDEFYAILFALSVYSVAANPNLNIDNKVTVFIGQISYGVYMYHWIIILLVVDYLPREQNPFYYNLMFYGLSFGGTILVSWLSYITMERYFLNLKKRFETK